MNLIRPEITEERLEEIRCVIKENPEWNRTKISKHICKIWQWQSPTGQLKDISCRDMLRKLDKEGKISLPAPMRPPRPIGCPSIIRHIEHDTTPIVKSLSEVRPLYIENVNSREKLAIFKSCIDLYHYLGFDRTVGENMKYMVYSRDGKLLSCLLFGSAAWSCRERDEFIGWDKTQRARGLINMTNNTRFLIPQWIRVPHLASHILALIARQISNDWEIKYGHPVCCLETFIENARFVGTCYKAANWIRVGSTTGLGRNGGHKHAILPIKDIYLYPLVKDFRSALTCDNYFSLLRGEVSYEN
ncbi:MAG: hypothetical protein BWY27_00863 [Bacteroidetes bacterium ADurb.Bin234]|nr:MAG: hypothetical protein BWY27_00863 [Bacteroidetes bacterium ADurb.Bin234]